MLNVKFCWCQKKSIIKKKAYELRISLLLKIVWFTHCQQVVTKNKNIHENLKQFVARVTSSLSEYYKLKWKILIGATKETFFKSGVGGGGGDMLPFTFSQALINAQS